MADPHAHDTAPGTAPGTDIDTGEYAALFPTLTFDRPADGVLRITLDGPGLNAVSPQGHAHLVFLEDVELVERFSIGGEDPDLVVVSPGRGSHGRR